jgi:raffinose/stachyose/melibiose transport system permease protein
MQEPLTLASSSDTERASRTRRRPLAVDRVVLGIGLGLLAILWLVPFFFTLTTAIRSQGDLLSRGIFAVPEGIEWQNFADAWRRGGFNVYFRNSLMVTLIKVPVGILISALAAYPLAKLSFRFSNFMFLFFLMGITIPVHVTLLPVTLLLKQLGLLGTLLALFPPYITFGLPFQIFVMRGFFSMIPSELLESARLDGASEFTIFFRIMLPLSSPALATLAIIDSLSTWNEFLMALIFVSDRAWQTVPLGLMNFQGEFSSHYGVLTAGVLISIIPVLILYVLFQRYLVSGLTAGALKG